MPKYELETTQKTYRKQLNIFREDTGFLGIFKKNLDDDHKIIGEEVLGVTKNGQLVKIRLEHKTVTFEW